MVNNLVSEKVYQNQGNKPVLDQVPSSAITILDVGCGVGDNARILKRDGRIIDGITLSDKEAECAAEFMSSVFVHNLENGLPPEIVGQYDAVICSHVLEHIAYPNQLLTDIRRCLTPGGVLIVALPNIMGYRSRIQLILGNFNYEESGVWDNTHLRWYTFKTGQELLNKNGFEVVMATVDGDIPFGDFFRFLSTDQRQAMFRFLRTVSKGLFGGQLLYTAQAT